MRNQKLGRNAPCYCGSGKKFKKCHGNIASPPTPSSQLLLGNRELKERAALLIEQKRARIAQQQRQQGLGRPIISVEFQGSRFVAVGSRLLQGNWKTFFDFLGDYIKQTLGPEWGTAQIQKPLGERHPILRWYDHLCRLQQSYSGANAGVFSGPMTGAASAYYRLAYNLYLIAHNGTDVQTRLLSRLRNAENFPGAFFETQVAAWLINAGFELEFEDESDGSTSHCEFTAHFPDTGEKFSVEAKSRLPGENAESPKRIRVGQQLRNALSKRAMHTRLVFLDLSRPLTSELQAQRLVDRAQKAMKTVEGLLVGNLPAPPAYVCLTNISDHYFPEQTSNSIVAAFYGFKIPDFFPASFPSIREALRARERHKAMHLLMRSMEMHRGIPATFDGERPSIAFGFSTSQPMQIGQTYEIASPSEVVVRARLTAATVDVAKKEMILAFHDEATDEAWNSTKQISEIELEEYLRHSDTYFGVVQSNATQLKDPLALFDFFFSSYKSTPKDRLLELLDGSSDIAELKALGQSELAEIYCERLVSAAISINPQPREQAAKPSTRD